MKIVSLLPSAIEIACALGLRDQLVGETHVGGAECRLRGEHQHEGLPAARRGGDARVGGADDRVGLGIRG